MKFQSLRYLIKNDPLTVAPGCHDALGAKIIENAGFKALSISGFGVSASLLGKPDIGLVTMSEIVSIARNIVSTVNIPVICDADTGYGNINNVIRTVEEFEAAGVSAIHIEDQVTPKKCSLQGDLELVTLDEYSAKLEAAIQAKKNEDFMIIARTDACLVYGLDEAIRRGKSFAKQGADIIYIEGIKSLEDIKKIRESIPNTPLYYNMQEKSEYPFMSNSELEKLGFNLVAYPITGTRAYIKSLTELMESLKKDGTTKNFGWDQLSDVNYIEKLLGIQQIKNREKNILTNNNLDN